MTYEGGNDMKKKVLAAFLATAMVCGLLTGCHDSS